jgi:hypothetical protein
MHLIPAAATAAAALATVIAGAAANTGHVPSTSSAAITCHARTTATGPLPDAACTPGATNPAVTQANIRSTICVAGWTATIRPSASYTNRVKRQQMVAYGFHDQVRAHEEDHLISLELGGAPRDPRNLWPEPGASPNPKDKVENTLRRAVCAGRLPLAEAQRRIATDWTTAVAGLGS